MSPNASSRSEGARPRASPGIVAVVIDVTDATFEAQVIERSAQVPVVVDLWAPWCGPCRTLGPIIEKVVAATDGAVELVKVNVDENPRISQTFQVQSIPAVYALRDRAIVDMFIGALPEAQVAEFVSRLTPAPSEADLLVMAGDESSLRQALEMERDHTGAVLALSRLLVDKGEPAEALELLDRIPATSPPRPGWPSRTSPSPPTASVPCSTACSSGSGRTSRPARSSWTCWRPWASTIPAPPTTARRSPPGCSEGN
jgi:putative thioredoxin